MQNECSADKPIDIDMLSKPVDLECTQLCLAQCLLVVEVRKGNGEPYPSKTVYHLLAGLLRFAPSESTCPYFLDPKHVWYKKLQGTMDTHFRRLRQADVGAEVKNAGIISDQVERLFWDQRRLDTHFVHARNVRVRMCVSTCAGTPNSYLHSSPCGLRARMMMAESGDRSDVPLVVLAHYNDMTVLQKGRSFQYMIPSFPVFTVTLREVKLQWEDDNGDLHLFDGFMRECELLNHPLPAIARIPHSYRHAGMPHPYTN